MSTRTYKVDPERQSLKLELWPDVDQLALQMAIRSDDWLEEPGLAASWAEATRRSAIQAYGRWLGWLVWTGRLDVLTAPAERATPELVAQYAADLEKHMIGSTVATYITWLSLMLRVMAPESNLSWLKAVIKRLRYKAGAPADKRPRLVPVADLLAFGIDLMTEIDTTVTPLPSRAATQFRDGLMISLLAARVPRMRNFISIEIGKQLIRRGDRYMLNFEAEETKSRRRPIVSEFPATLVPYLSRYLQQVRLQMLTRYPKIQDPVAGCRLWIAQTGDPLSDRAFSFMLRKRTTARFGRSINPHLFRDCAATSTATDDPENVGITAALLGHANLKTSEKYYNHAKSDAATQRYQKCILALRNERQAN